MARLESTIVLKFDDEVVRLVVNRLNELEARIEAIEEKLTEVYGWQFEREGDHDHDDR